MSRPKIVLATALVVVLGAPAAPTRSEQVTPVYVGARVCASCHEGEAMGQQFSRWLLSKHSRAWAVLALPEAGAIAELSGIPGDPQEAIACLGCHATAADAEDWERDPTFHVEDGVQCERCHGPGSEYIAEDVMRDRDAAVRAGLRFLSPRECELCHYEKGSHVAIHHLPKLDPLDARRALAHPTPASARPGSPPSPPSSGSKEGSARYVGAARCGACHRGAAMGHTFSVWKLSPHARAYAVLSTARAAEIATSAGVTDPQHDAACLDCHTTGPVLGGFAEGFSLTEGVGCEACHGPGSEYVAEAIMRDPRAAAEAGLRPVGRETCDPCHAAAHGRPFDVGAAMREIAHRSRPPERASGPRYKTPVNLAVSPDGTEVFVVGEASDSVIVVDVRTLRRVAEIPVGRQPNDVAFAPGGGVAYVSNRLDDSVSVIDVASRLVVDTIRAGDEPHGLLVDPSGSTLYVLDTAADRVSVIDVETGREIKRLAASRNPWSLALSPDGAHVLVTNNLSRFVQFRTAPVSEVTVIDARDGVVENRIVLPGTNLVQGVSWHPDGEFALVTMNRTKNLVPMTRIVQGWTITNGLGVLWRDGRVDQVLLDEPNLYFPDAADVAISPDGRWALVTSSGSDRVAVVDVARLVDVLRRATEHEREHVLPNHLGKSAEFVARYVSTGASPRGVVFTDDGRWAFVANALDDSLTVIDMERLEAAGRVDLGGPTEITSARRGERLFHSANITFQRQFSCSSCHPDGHVDGITYDIEPDGIGFNPVDNRSLRGILDTAPFKWTGKNPSLRRQCGARLAVFFTRIQPFTPEQLSDLERYISTIPRPPNRNRPLGADLTDAQRRGKKIFERATTTDGRPIPENKRCVTCHFPPLYTDRSKRDVGTIMRLDDDTAFDVPHLTNIYDSAPYLHNGIAATLEEIWTRFNPEDRHGVTNDLTKDELNDLIEYLKTL